MKIPFELNSLTSASFGAKVKSSEIAEVWPKNLNHIISKEQQTVKCETAKW